MTRIPSLKAPIKLLLTGERGAGKSTIVRKLREKLQLPPAGFLTLPTQSPRGFEIVDLACGGRAPIGIFNPAGELEPCASGFESVGFQALENARHLKAKLLIMDELGFLELGAPGFKASVLRALGDFPLILGVIKLRDNPFLREIKQICGLEIVEINPGNREEVLSRLQEYFRVSNNYGADNLKLNI